MTRIFSVRHSTARPSTITGPAMRRRADPPRRRRRARAARSPRRVSTVAPTAAGLKMCRPCHARTYFERDAAPAASTIPASADEVEGGAQHEQQDVRGDERGLQAPRQLQDRAGPRHPPRCTRASSTASVTTSSSGVGATRPEERGSERDDGEAGEGEHHEAVHRQPAEQVEAACRGGGERAGHPNNSAVLPGDHSTRPSVVIRTHSHAPRVGERAVRRRRTAPSRSRRPASPWRRPPRSPRSCAPALRCGRRARGAGRRPTRVGWSPTRRARHPSPRTRRSRGADRTDARARCAARPRAPRGRRWRRRSTSPPHRSGRPPR